MTCDTCIHKYVCRWASDDPHPDCGHYSDGSEFNPTLCCNLDFSKIIGDGYPRREPGDHEL